MTRPHIIIIATETDISAKLIKEAAEKVADTDFYYYQELAAQSLPTITLKNHTPESILIARQPYTANQVEQNYVPYLAAILEKYSFKKVLDGKLYEHAFVQYEDKFYHNYLFEKFGMTFAPFADISKPEAIEYPIIAKKRLSSRAESNFIIKSSDELRRFIFATDVTQFIFQKFYDLVADYRVLILNNQLVGVARRKVVIKYGYKATVQVDSIGEVPQDIADQCCELTKHLGCDLCGFDVGETKEGKLFFIEYNTSPQFNGYQRETGKDLAAEIVQSLIS